jgi:hypothetical protein
MHKLLIRLAVLAILATLTVACGKGSPTTPTERPAPADPRPGVAISLRPATQTSQDGALGNQHFVNRQSMNEEVVYTATGGDPSAEWQFVTDGRPGMQFRRLSTNQFAVRLTEGRREGATLYVDVHSGPRTAILVLEQAN